MNLYNLFPELKTARACFNQKNYEISCDIYSDLLSNAKCEKESPLLCVIYLEYCEALIRNCENYFMDFIRDISSSKIISTTNKEDDLEVAWDLLELSKSVFMAKQDSGIGYDRSDSNKRNTKSKTVEYNNKKTNIEKNKTTESTAKIPEHKNETCDDMYFVDLDDNVFITECLAQSYFLLGEIQLLNNDFLGAITDYTNCMVELERIEKQKTTKFCEALYKTATCNEFMKYYEEALKMMKKIKIIYSECNELDDEKREFLVNELNDRIGEIEYKRNKEDGEITKEVENDSTNDEEQEVPVININSLKKKKK